MRVTPSNFCATILGLTITLAGCTGGGGQKVLIQPQPAAGVQPQRPADQKNESQLPPIELDEAELKTKAALNTADLSYKFTYITFTESKAIVFTAGKAQIVLSGLPSEQSGTATLEVMEAGVVKLRGATQNVVLKKGQNNSIALTLAAVDPNNPTLPGGNTDLTIDVSLEGSGGSVIPVTPPVVPPVIVPPVIVPPVIVPPVVPPVTPPTVDPVADWDGRSFKGNAKWSIIEVKP